jgi:hypothetical protein
MVRNWQRVSRHKKEFGSKPVKANVKSSALFGDEDIDHIPAMTSDGIEIYQPEIDEEEDEFFEED